jgi:PH domain/Ankyrin repeat
VLVLLRAGATSQIDAQNEEGATALSRAARWGHDDVVELLLRHRAKTDIADKSGKRPIDWARLKNHDFCAALLLGQPRASVVTLPSSSSAPAVSAVLTSAPPPAPPATPSAVVTPRKSLAGTPPPLIATPASASAAAADGGHGGAALGHLPSIFEDGDGDGALHYLSEEDEDGGATQGTVGPNNAYGSEMDDGNAPLPEDCYDLGTPLHVEGWMAKQGQIFKTWKNRWFVLDGRRMAYYTKEGAPKPKGVIEMIEGTDVVIEEKYPKPFCFTISTPTKRYILQAADEDEMVEWIEAVMNNLECVAPGDMSFGSLGAGTMMAEGEADDD